MESNELPPKWFISIIVKKKITIMKTGVGGETFQSSLYVRMTFSLKDVAC